jgi:hypothetical protein
MSSAVSGKPRSACAADQWIKARCSVAISRCVSPYNAYWVVTISGKPTPTLVGLARYNWSRSEATQLSG